MMTFKELIRGSIPQLLHTNLETVYFYDDFYLSPKFRLFSITCNSNLLTQIRKLMEDCRIDYTLSGRDYMDFSGPDYKISAYLKEISKFELRKKILRWAIKDDLNE